MTFLLDTVTLSEPSRRRPSPSVMGWLASQSEEQLFISVMTIGELRYGAARLHGKQSRPELHQWIKSAIGRFEGRILDVDQPVVERWGAMLASLDNTGRHPELVDSLIAATALTYDLTVVTRNVSDFERCGVPVLNPWEG